MNEQSSVLAALTVVVGGLLHGSFALPMKRMAQWKWENIWLVYSVVGLVVFPLLLALATVPALGQAIGDTPASTLLLIVVCGMGWGIGSTLFGLAIARVGMALAFAVILGITSSVGSLLPLVVRDPGALVSQRGAVLLGGLAMVIVGITVCSLAGARRDRKLNPQTGTHKSSGYATGLLICLASGLLSPALNFGFDFGEPLKAAAVKLGAQPDLAGNAIWALGLGGGFFINAGYAVFLLAKNGTWGVYSAPGAKAWYWLGASLMGLLWYSGISIYGMGATQMGPTGTSVGWPIFMSVVIMAANVWGALSGEWKGAGAGGERPELARQRDSGGRHLRHRAGQVSPGACTPPHRASTGDAGAAYS